MRSWTRILAGIGIGALSVGCVVVGPGGPPPGAYEADEHGPPPHAPAHGYRAHRGDRDLVFDSAIGAYVVVGVPDLWFFDGSFVRWTGVGWEIGPEAIGPWRAAPSSAVPTKLRGRHHPHGGPPGQLKKHERD